MSAGLEFNWPGTAQTAPSVAPVARPLTTRHGPPPAPAVDTVLARLLEATPAQLVALADKAECERRLHQALDRIAGLERMLNATRSELADARSAVQAQRIHIDALTTHLRRTHVEPEALAAPSLRTRLLPSAIAAG